MVVLSILQLFFDEHPTPNCVLGTSNLILNVWSSFQQYQCNMRNQLRWSKAVSPNNWKYADVTNGQSYEIIQDQIFLEDWHDYATQVLRASSQRMQLQINCLYCSSKYGISVCPIQLLHILTDVVPSTLPMAHLLFI